MKRKAAVVKAAAADGGDAAARRETSVGDGREWVHGTGKGGGGDVGDAMQNRGY